MTHSTQTTGCAAIAGVLFLAIVAGHELGGVDQPHTHRDAHHLLEQSRRAAVTDATSLGSIGRNGVGLAVTFTDSGVFVG